MSANLGWLFNIDYFDGLNYRDDTYNEDLLKEKVSNIINQSPPIPEYEYLGNMSFSGTTTYPGILMGTGYMHELNKIKGQAILGFHFDYSTGLPVIPGSSIKGVVRSAFAHPEYIRELLDDDQVDIGALELDIFGQPNGSSDTQQGKDIFFDAVITGAISKILGDDHLAPHGSNPMLEPDVLRFIKVMPQVTFAFDFKLQDSEGLTANQKALLFAQILEDIGIGAKTNVGYGYLEMDTSSIPQPSEFDKLLEKIEKGLGLNDANKAIKELSEPLNDEQKKILFDIFNAKLLDSNSDLDNGWYGESIEQWMCDTDISNGFRKKLIGYEYLNIFKTLYLK